MVRDYPVTQRPTRCPTHPGVILRDDVLPALELSVSEAARQLRVTRQTLHRIMAGETAITPGMALRLGKFCGNGPGLWLRGELGAAPQCGLAVQHPLHRPGQSGRRTHRRGTRGEARPPSEHRRDDGHQSGRQTNRPGYRHHHPGKRGPVIAPTYSSHTH